MFYSQFILARKGPLGTIWIAAHLERKLRKNQVADTDIGVSVDSILFPEVPIALRLSSHLLLGVVRIYSRKVNYLFDDCSEALLKIKQAFRSAAVDLPPEESTAPYHSITLPETFDLDDFELPDNEILQGNYVDHHVSAREQITLQDTMEGVVYPTSQFGLDERFGDGDTCQITFDLDQDSLLEKVAAPLVGGDSTYHPHGSTDPMTPFEGDGNDDEISKVPEELIDHCNGSQGEVLETHSEFIDYAEAPATPGLIGEANLSSIKDNGVSDDHLAESAATEGMPAEENGLLVGESEVTQADQLGNVQTSAGENAPAHEDSGALTNNAVGSVDKRSGCNTEADAKRSELESARSDEGVRSFSHSPTHLEPEKEHTGKNSGSVEKVYPLDKASPYVEAKVYEELKDPETSDTILLGVVHDNSKECHRCSDSDLNEQGISFAGVDNECPAAAFVEPVSDDNQIGEPPLCGGIQNEGEQLRVVTPNEQSENLDNSATLALPSPEKLLSVQNEITNVQNKLLEESTPDKMFDEAGLGSAAMEQISGRKRNFTETLGSMQSDSLKSFGLTLSKRTEESVPDDDDLLSSILVGRRSSALRMKPSPAPTEVTFSKRQKTAHRASAHKRKVLMDDTMVLHGDAIRQQLISTEDLRRVRQKAPCTLPEISAIQRNILGDEIFSEPIITGLAAEISCMHKKVYDLSKTRICEHDEGIAHAVAASEIELSAKADVNEDTERGGDFETTQSSKVLPRSEDQHDEDLGPGHPIIDSDVQIAHPECLDKMTETEVDKERIVGCDSAEYSTVLKHDSQILTDPLSKDTVDATVDDLHKSDLINKDAGVGESVHVDTSLPPSDTLNSQCCEEDSAKVDILMGEGVDVIDVAERDVPSFGVEAECQQVAGGFMDEQKCGGSVDVGVNTWRDNFSVANDGSMSSRSMLAADECNVADPSTEHIGNSSARLLSDEVPDLHLECNVVDPSVCRFDKPEVDSIHVLANNGDICKVSLIDEENACCPDAQSGKDMDILLLDDNVINDRDFEDMMTANDTEFLNVDDDDGVTDNEYIVDVEESQLLENSGWSSRTRAVAKYLQTFFHKEAVHGKRGLVMENLLAGKTRKEASRLFFESLVLKTRDYIHVEQEMPFDNINIKPGVKLMKSDF